MKSPVFRIQKIKIHNFKNFKDIEITLDRFNVIVGANASGKSNLIQIFVFLRDIMSNGLEYAISAQGGNGYTKNLRTRDNKLEMEFQFVSDVEYEIPKIRPRGSVMNKAYTNEVSYNFSIDLNNGAGYKIRNDILKFHSTIVIADDDDVKYRGNLIIKKENDKVTWDHDFPEQAGSIVQQQYEFFQYSPLKPNQLLLESRVMGFIVPQFGEYLDSIGVYDFEPKTLKQSSQLRSKSKLETNGSNLSLVLSKILVNKEKSRIFKNLVGDLLPFFNSINFETNRDSSVRFNIKEKFSVDDVPAIFISDGTANILALITCLFLQNNRLSIIEEPERNIHPALFSKIIAFMQNEASFTNQIIVTTHNPAILEYVNFENVFLIQRSPSSGNSSIHKAQDSKTIERFKKILTKTEMMTRNLLR